MLKKVTVERALNAELNDHLGYDIHQSSNISNSRNGYSQKTLSSDEGSFEIDIPHDRNGSFEPQLVKKHQTRLTMMDDKIPSQTLLAMSGRAMIASMPRE